MLDGEESSNTKLELSNKETMMSQESELNFVKRLCILNFLELQEMKRK